MISRVMLFGMTCLLLSGGAFAALGDERHDAGDAPKYARYKNRTTAPGKAAIDGEVTLGALLAKNDEHAFSMAKGATVEGYAVQAEQEEDGDFHLVLATERGESSTTKWVIAEVTPSWRKKQSAFAPSRLHALVGHKLRVTGWLYYEPDTDSDDPRGTRWELHPVTSITVLDAAPARDHR
jgi:hypothetical protein